MIISCTTLNTFSLFMTAIFGVLSLLVYPKKETKCILALISISQMINSALFLSLAFSRWLSLEHHLKLLKVSAYLEPLAEVNQYLYFCYSLHRYAIVFDQDSQFTFFRDMPSILLSAFLSVIVTYASSLIRILWLVMKPFCFCEGCTWRCQALFTTSFAVRFTITLLLIGLQIYTVRRTIKKLAETKQFLCSLPRSDKIDNRLLALPRINRFNIKLSVLYILPMSFKVLRRFTNNLVVVVLMHTSVEYFRMEQYICETIETLMQPTCSIIFVLIHAERFRRHF